MAAPQEAPPRTARDMAARGREFLARKGVEAARLEAELLVAHALGLDRMHLFLELERPVAAAEIAAARELLMRRAAGEPTAYLIGRREFYARDFEVGPGVLVPRPETELLVDLARERLAAAAALAPRIAEVGTGSGCIAVTLALELRARPGGPAVVRATELSERALAFARRNAERLGAEVELLAGDGLAPLVAAHPDERYDLVLSNPPYVDPDDPAGLDPAVRAHEPAAALFTPPGDREHWIRRLCAEGLPLLRPGGALLIELGFDQGPGALAVAREHGGGRAARLHRDLAGVERVLEVG